MLERLAHRGPDDRGAVQGNGSWLGHRRLSIVEGTEGSPDLVAARQVAEHLDCEHVEVTYYRVWREHLQGISAERTLARFARA